MAVIDEIKQAVALADLLGTTDKRICCPLPGHDDKSPSCDVDHNKGLWHCKTCDVGGSVIDFVMQRDRLTVGEAIRFLADKANIPLTGKSEEAKATYEKEKRIFAARAYAVDYYHQYLLQHQGGQNYLDRRGITLETISKLKLGWSNGKLHQALTEAMPEGLSFQDFVNAGLLVERARDEERGGPKYADWFDARLIFPLFIRGRVANMSGRQTDYSHSKEKYRHLKGVPVENFYNEDAIADATWVFEGHPDTVTGVQLGLPAVGIIGTSGMTHPERLAVAKEIWLCPDNDAPGKRAADKWVEALLRKNPDINLRFVPLPDGVKDFNEWAVKNVGRGLQDAFEALKGTAKNLVEYKISLLQTTDDLKRIWPYLEPMAEIKRDKWFKLIKEQMPALSVVALRKDFKEWKLGKVANKSENLIGCDFQPNKVKHYNVGFSFGSEAKGHVCLWGNVKRVDDEGHESSTHEPVLVESVLNEAGYSARITPISNCGIPVEHGKIPPRSIVEGRWSDLSIQSFLAGEHPPVDTAILASRIANLFKTYVWYKDASNYEILAFYTMGTYVARIFNSYGYLVFNGLMETGKSNSMALLHQLCFNAIDSVSSSISSIYRTIESSFSTWIRDEAEAFNKVTSDNGDELQILNSGYKSGAVARRTGKNAAGQMEQEEFEIYSPKIFGGINILNPVLMSRGILIKSHRAPKEIVKGMPRMVQTRRVWEKECAEIRDLLYVWMLTKFQRVKEIFDDYPALDVIINREWEIWLPILTLAYLADEESVEKKDPKESFTARVVEFAQEKGKEKKQVKDEEAIEIKVLEAIVTILNDKIVTAPWKHPGWYSVNLLAKKVTESFIEEGLYKEQWTFSSRRLMTVLTQTNVIKDRLTQVDKFKVENKTVTHVQLDKSEIESAITAL